MKTENFMQAHAAVLRLESLKKQKDSVNRNAFAVTIENMFQDQKMLAAVKDSIIHELELRIADEQTLILKCGFEIED